MQEINWINVWWVVDSLFDVSVMSHHWHWQHWQNSDSWWQENICNVVLSILFNKVIQYCKSMWFCILKKKKKIMKYFISEIFVLINTFLLINSTSDTEFEEDFIHSFLIKSEKLKKSERLKSAGDGWLEKTAYKVKLYMKYFSIRLFSNLQ